MDLFVFATQHPGWRFLFTPIGAGLSGYTPEEMNGTLVRAVVRRGAVPANVVIPPDLYGPDLHWTQT